MICDKIVVFFIVFVIQQPYVAKIPHLYSACQVFQGFFAYATANIFFASANSIFAGACGNFALANWLGSKAGMDMRMGRKNQGMLDARPD